MAEINTNAVFMKESPFTSIEVQKYNSFSWYDADINKEFNESIANAESEVNKHYPEDKPESVSIALYYLRKALYEYYLENARAKHVNPGAFFVGPSNYKGNPDKARKIDQKASEKLATAYEYLRKAIKREHVEEQKEVTKSENDLEVGDKIRVWWTNCNRQYQAIGLVKKINRKTMIVTLQESVSSDFGTYPENWDITIPILCTKGNKWEHINKETAPQTKKELSEEYQDSLKGLFSIGDRVYNTFYRFEGTVIKINKQTMIIKGEPTYQRDDGLRKVPIDAAHNKKIEATA